MPRAPSLRPNDAVVKVRNATSMTTTCSLSEHEEPAIAFFGVPKAPAARMGRNDPAVNLTRPSACWTNDRTGLHRGRSSGFRPRFGHVTAMVIVVGGVVCNVGSRARAGRRVASYTSWELRLVRALSNDDLA